jgi:hypothetical protein
MGMHTHVRLKTFLKQQSNFGDGLEQGFGGMFRGILRVTS